MTGTAGTTDRRQNINRSLRLCRDKTYDFRNPANSGIETLRLYAEILHQVAWLDGRGPDLVWFRSAIPYGDRGRRQ